MEHTKTILLLALFIAAGVIFIIAGLCLSSDKYLALLGKHASEGKAAGRISLGMGIVTMLFGIAMYWFPSALEVLAVVYLAILLVAVGAAEVYMKIRRGRK